MFPGPDHQDVVSALDERFGDLVLRLLDPRLHLLLEVFVLPLGVRRIEQDDNLHDSEGSAPWRRQQNTVVRASMAWVSASRVAHRVQGSPPRPYTSSSN